MEAWLDVARENNLPTPEARYRRTLARNYRHPLLDAVRVSGAANARKGPSVARSQDFLYDKDGLPK
jgi:SH3-like domain-containing protein